MTILILTAVLLTSVLSGILGMGGGMILMGVLTLILPVSSAMILHGFVQLSSNGSRAYIHRSSIQWSILPYYILGSLIAFLVINSVTLIPSKSLILIILGLFPFLSFLLQKKVRLNILKPRTSALCGLLVTSTQMLAGASGPVLDTFYLQTPLNRHQVIATKALTQSLGHILKTLFYLRIASGSEVTLEWTWIVLCMFIANAGTQLGKSILNRISETQFQTASSLVVPLIGLIYLIRGVLDSV